MCFRLKRSKTGGSLSLECKYRKIEDKVATTTKTFARIFNATMCPPPSPLRFRLVDNLVVVDADDVFTLTNLARVERGRGLLFAKK